MGIFDDILAGVPEADKAVLARYPALKASMERLETDVTLLAPYAQKATAWEEWRAQNWDQAANMTVQEKALKVQLDAATARLNAGRGTQADVDQLAALRAELDTKLSAVKDDTAKQLGGMHYFYKAFGDKIVSHRDEFGATLQSQALIDYMAANKIDDADVAYEKMVAPLRAANAQKAADASEAAHKQAVADAEKRGFERAEQERAMGPGGPSPTDHSGGIVGVTSFVEPAKKLSDEVLAAYNAAKPGTGELAKLGYSMYRSGQLTDAA